VKGARIRLHLVRAAPPAGAIADQDWVVELDALVLADHGTPPLPPGPIDHDQLVTLIFAADQVLTW
jgi:hypothetical protein